MRSAVQRSYIVHLADMDSLRAGLRTWLKVAMEEALATAQPCCPLCQAEDMEQIEPADVLYVVTEYCFQLAAPRWRCFLVGCDGIFTRSPSTANCFPATPKVSWDVTQSHRGQRARWFDLRMLQILDAWSAGPAARWHCTA